MKKKLKIIVIAFLFILLSTMYLKTMAATNCSPVTDDKVKYVNATLTRINREEYNSLQRGMHWTDYYPLPMSQRYEIDQKSMLMASTEGMCVGGIQNGYIGLSQYGNSTGVLQGLAKDKLVNGDLSIVDKYTNGTSFFPTVNSNTDVYMEVLSNWKFPFVKEKNGYYSFNSDQYHVYRDYSTKTFKLHEGTRNGFYPFNNCEDDTSIMGNRNLGFTARIEIPFIMTKDGKVKNSETGQFEDMIFDFSGDDDVWVYVDDKLVLDLGGCHARLRGNINFAKNQVYYESIYNPETNQDEKDVYKSAFEEGMLSQGEHTLTLFYMERAGGESNLFVTFNLQSGGVQANYIDIDTNTKLDVINQSGPVGDSVTTEAKNINGYTLVKKPENENITLTEELQVVNYYYAKNTTVTAKYIDEVTNQEISPSTVINGKSGDDYTTEQKTIDNYDFTKVDGNPSGTMRGEPINVTYYYRHKSKITVNYIDKETGEIIASEQKDAHEGDTFTSEERQFEDFKLIEKPNNPTVTVAREDITLNYYYQRLKFNLQIEMNLEKAYINGNYYGLEGKADKIETEIKDANSASSLQVYYKVKVTNNQDKLGNGYITFTIPEGFKFISPDWEVSGNTAKFKVADLNAGETREYEIIIEKSAGVDISRNIIASIRIDSEKLPETTLEDNEDVNELGIMPRTGIIILNLLPIILGFSILAVVIILKLKRNIKKENEINKSEVKSN